MQNLSKYTSFVLYGLLLATIVAFALFFTGGYVDANAEYLEPNNTDLVLNLGYLTIGIGLVCTVVFAVYQFGTLLIDAPKKAFSTIAWLAGFAALMGISWSAGSGQPMVIPGYEGVQNVYFWLKLTDMWMYSAGFLLAASIGSIVLFGLIKIIRK